ncbi:right-handed parallel beta-helix repeat-containing protein [Pradoshia sp.]
MVPIILQVRLTALLTNTKFWLLLLSVMVILSILAVKLKPDEELKGLPKINEPAEEVRLETIYLQDEINQASINGGGTVTIPKGVYAVDEPIILKSNVHLKGAGMGESVIRLNLKKSKGMEDDSTILKTEPNAQNVQISDLTFDGEKDKRKKQINDSYSHTIVLQFVDGFNISRVEVLRSPSASIMLFNSRNGSVTDSKIIDGGSNGIIGLQKTENVQIINNEIDHTDHQNGIFISYQEGKSSENVTIEGNKVKDAGDFGIEVGHLVEDGEEQHVNIKVRNNEVVGSRNSGIAFRTVSDGEIENNIIKGYGKTGGYGGDGIFVEGWKNQSANVTVSNNIVEQTYTTGDANAIYVTGMENTVIENNEIKASRGKGLFVQASVIGENTGDFPEGIRLFNQLTIQGNKIYEGKMEGIHLQGYKAEDIVIAGNEINHNLSAGLLIANLDVMSRGLEVSDNIIKDNGLAGIDMYSQEDFIFERNRLVNNGQKAKDRKNRSAIVMFNVGNGVLKQNTYEDSQKVPTQKYYLQIAELTGQVTQQDAEFIGLLPELSESTSDYLE